MGVKGTVILDALTEIGVTGKTMASSIANSEAHRVRVRIWQKYGIKPKWNPPRQLFGSYLSEIVDHIDVFFAQGGTINGLRGVSRRIVASWDAAISNGYVGDEVKTRVTTELNKLAKKRGFDSFDSLFDFLNELNWDLGFEPRREFEGFDQKMYQIRCVARKLKVSKISLGQAVRILMNPSDTELNLTWGDGKTEFTDPNVLDHWIIMFGEKKRLSFKRIPPRRKLVYRWYGGKRIAGLEQG
jgi:hypothetical protein